MHPKGRDKTTEDGCIGIDENRLETDVVTINDLSVTAQELMKKSFNHSWLRVTILPRFISITGVITTSEKNSTSTFNREK